MRLTKEEKIVLNALKKSAKNGLPSPTIQGRLFNRHIKLLIKASKKIKMNVYDVTGRILDAMYDEYDEKLKIVKKFIESGIKKAERKK